METDEYYHVWHLSKAVIDRYSSITNKCSEEDDVEDIVCEIYSINKNKSIEVWQWLLDVFYDEVKGWQNIRNSIIEVRLFLFVSYHFPDAIHRYSEGVFADTPLDIFIPSKQVAIKCHGISYEQGEKKFGKDWLIQTGEPDKQMEYLCKENGITLSVWDYLEHVSKKLLLKKTQ